MSIPWVRSCEVTQTLWEKGLSMCSLCSLVQSPFSHGLGRFCVYVSLSGNKGCILSVTVFWNFLIIFLETLQEIFQSLKLFLKLDGMHNLPKINRSRWLSFVLHCLIFVWIDNGQDSAHACTNGWDSSQKAMQPCTDRLCIVPHLTQIFACLTKPVVPGGAQNEW